MTNCSGLNGVARVKIDTTTTTATMPLTSEA